MWYNVKENPVPENKAFILKSSECTWIGLRVKNTYFAVIPRERSHVVDQKPTHWMEIPE